MYGMLTGTASTGIILLREIDPEFDTPAADNLVYQNFPAILLGFPMLIFATLAPVHPYITLIVLSVYFVALNIFLFRSYLFKKKK
jgi:ESS family glutamate:Na+ symporter